MTRVLTALIAMLAFATAMPAAAQEAGKMSPEAAMKALETAPTASAAVAATAAPTIQDPENVLHLDLSTGGRVSILMRPDLAPGHIERIKTLVRRGFYDGIIFHRVIEGFMAQTGDPQGTGQGGSDLPDLKAEFNALPHLRGTVSMARTQEPDSANSQFFIMFMPMTGTMDGNYTGWGRVFSGMEFVDKIARGEPPATPSRILKASIGADNVPPPPSPPTVAATAVEPTAVPAPAEAATPAPAATPATPAPAPVPPQN
ncbi:peptidylprolyl isomerase [Sphingosinicella soli]|uniref:Peptidyl-prolyl cis-trans isomerase n=1 Tax=Sphingosinicella soli TaxID=333708 RepID=A0A7W7B126_9SPHN|nr:peptidylprolyl isomerase [Sphingosinicella soli]MBB4631020.1 peptidylprolyl isomerase [Sphingosinicella soli]